jgi:uncharacterized protein YdeI (YjbR/CyaY-like superfamily)
VGAAVGQLSVLAASVLDVADDLEIIAFAAADELWSWLAQHHDTHPGVWVRLQKTNSLHPSISFHDLLEAGIAYGWSESTCRAHDRTSYVQKFTPRRTRGTTAQRNLTIADRLEAEGRMTPPGRKALDRSSDASASRRVRAAGRRENPLRVGSTGCRV